MKAYLVVTCILFGAFTVAHVCRVIVEGPRLAKEPLFVILTALTAILCAWAWGLLWRSSRLH